MSYLVFNLGALSLFGGFFVLSSYEESKGMRVFARARARLDREVARIEFIVEHVDLVAFAKDEARRAMSRFGHFVAHLSLQAVRSAERLLTRLVLYLRTRHPEDTAPRETSRPFVQKLSDFKGRLKAARTDVSNVNQ